MPESNARNHLRGPTNLTENLVVLRSHTLSRYPFLVLRSRMVSRYPFEMSGTNMDYAPRGLPAPGANVLEQENERLRKEIAELHAQLR
eukprot:2835678-Rhodomonas_salina.1